MSTEETKESLAVSNLMKNEDFRNFMWKHLQLCGTFNSTFDPVPVIHARQTGLRDAGLNLERDLKESALEDYFKMIRENNDG